MSKFVAAIVTFLFVGCNSSQTEPPLACAEAQVQPGHEKWPAPPTPSDSTALGKSYSEDVGLMCPLDGAPNRRHFAAKVTGVNSIGAIVGVHTGGLHKRNFTWSIVRNYAGYTPDSISDAEVELQLQTALAAWASVANLSFRQVHSGGEITFEWVPTLADVDLPVPNAIAVAFSRDSAGEFYADILPEAYGARIVFADRRIGPDTKMNWARPNAILTLATHEIGHFLGMWHAFMDPEYGPGKAYPKANDHSIMSYDYKCSVGACVGYLSEYDISVMEKKYGPNSQTRPLLELWVPGWNKHFYTTSWPEANTLAYSGATSGLTRFWGLVNRNQIPGTTALHRHYTEQVGVGPRHYYSTGEPLCAPMPLWYEGVMGYIETPSKKAPEGSLRLYSDYSASLKDNRLTAGSKAPEGYARGKVFGDVIPIDNLPPAAED